MAWGLDPKDVIQIDATIIVGVLILLSLNIYVPQAISKGPVQTVLLPPPRPNCTYNMSLQNNVTGTTAVVLWPTNNCPPGNSSKINSTTSSHQIASHTSHIAGQKPSGSVQSRVDRSLSSQLTAGASIPFMISAVVAAAEARGEDKAKVGTGALIGSFCILLVIVLYIAFALIMK